MLENGANQLTVVIPNYNHSRFIRQSIDSLLAQTLIPSRVIVIDDASTDTSVAIINEYITRHDFIELRRNPENIGVVPTLNLGLSMVETEYVAFLAADDFIEPTHYEKSISLLRRHPIAPFCASLSNYADESGRPIKSPKLAPLGTAPRYLFPAEVITKLMRYDSFFNGNSAIYRASSLRQIGGFDERLKSFCDGYAMQLLAAQNGVCFVPEVLCNWRRLETSSSAMSDANYQILISILRNLQQRLNETDAAAFPPSYRMRFEQRRRFSAIWAAAQNPHADLKEIMRRIGPKNPISRFLIVLAEKVFGRTHLRIPIFLVVRPGDLWTVLWRYF